MITWAHATTYAPCPHCGTYTQRSHQNCGKPVCLSCGSFHLSTCWHEKPVRHTIAIDRKDYDFFRSQGCPATTAAAYARAEAWATEQGYSYAWENDPGCGWACTPSGHDDPEDTENCRMLDTDAVTVLARTSGIQVNSWNASDPRLRVVEAELAALAYQLRDR